MNIAICDKSTEFMNKFIEELQAYDSLIDVYTFSEYEQLTLGGELAKYDCIFIATEINYRSGVEAALEIKRRFPHIEIVYITENCVEYCQRIFDYADIFRPFALIKKPVSRSFMRHVLDMLKRTIGRNGSNSVVVRLVDKEYISIPVSEILYVQHNNRISYIYTEGGECFETKFGISWFEENLPDSFLHCSKSCLVNLHKIQTVNDVEIELKCGERLWSSRQYKKSFIEQYRKFLNVESGSLSLTI